MLARRINASYLYIVFIERSGQSYNFRNILCEYGSVGDGTLKSLRNYDAYIVPIVVPAIAYIVPVVHVQNEVSCYACEYYMGICVEKL